MGSFLHFFDFGGLGSFFRFAESRSFPLGVQALRNEIKLGKLEARLSLVGRAEEYLWSSARAHSEGADPSGTLDLGSWSEICSANDWGEALVGGADAVDEIRTATRAGNPFGDDRFVAELERKAGRSLRCKPPGPHAKSRSATA